jgi:DNA-binding NtrC family response regulator
VSDRDTISDLVTEQGEPDEPANPGIVLLLHHRDGVKALALEKDVPVVVGRAWPADAVVRDLKLSRRHARITLDDEGVLLEDLGSTNGTFLNGERIERARLGPGDEAKVGSVALSAQLLSSREALAAHSAEGYDRFSARLEEEVVRARTFGRPLAVLLVRGLAAEGPLHVRQLLPQVRRSLRPVDLVGLYGPGRLVAALPETGLDAALSLARALAAGRSLGSPHVLVGVAAFPGCATTAEGLVAAARQAEKNATIDAPVQGPAPLPVRPEAAPIVVSPAMRHVFETVGRVGRTTAPVLIVGETGTGKEVVARALHEQSSRSAGPLRAVNCAAIPSTLVEGTLFGHERGAFTGADRARAGLFEQSAGGTVFLDEVGELSPAVQATLLRVLEAKRLVRIGGSEEIPVDVRVVSATHRDLEAMVEGGQFRQDLYFRLNAITIEVPPLRSRPEEIEPLASLFAEIAARESGLPARHLDPGAVRLLQRYRWPGNVRELRNAIERAVVIAEGTTIGPDDLPKKVQGEDDGRPSSPAPANSTAPEGDGFKDRVRRYETELIVDALERAGGNQTRAAALLRMPLRTLVHKIRVYGIKKTYE